MYNKEAYTLHNANKNVQHCQHFAECTSTEDFCYSGFTNLHTHVQISLLFGYFYHNLNNLINANMMLNISRF